MRRVIDFEIEWPTLISKSIHVPNTFLLLILFYAYFYVGVVEFFSVEVLMENINAKLNENITIELALVYMGDNNVIHISFN